jgi:hypothetical protein
MFVIGYVSSDSFMSVFPPKSGLGDLVHLNLSYRNTLNTLNYYLKHYTKIVT